LQTDITLPSTIPLVLGALGGKKADLVVCDGAPDGKSSVEGRGHMLTSSHGSSRSRRIPAFSTTPSCMSHVVIKADQRPSH
jgi:23S rRNA U2552 (ribose-2'-O)-methylase RlmE/FtsJ